LNYSSPPGLLLLLLLGDLKNQLFMSEIICRGCRKLLAGTGKPGSQVHDPTTRIPAKWNWYGGWVCCEQCDYNSSLELERSMPGHLGQQSLSIGSESLKSVRRNWPKS
jgi:hypothetical protein